MELDGARSKYDSQCNEVKIRTCQSNINLINVPVEAAGPFCILLYPSL